MASYDIGIDLGTTKIIIHAAGRGIVLDEPAIIARNNRTGKVVAVGKAAYSMLGRTPEYITAVAPLKEGVISNLSLTQTMIGEFLRRASESMMIKPRVIICVPSAITEVEKRAVIEAADFAGARKVFLIEEPIAAALGANIDISKPNGVMVVDIGGGTTDAAVISLNGIVEKQSSKSAGNALDAAIIKYMTQNYKILIGDKMAENIKCQSGNVYDPSSDAFAKVKGRNMITGLPQSIDVSELEIYQALHEAVYNIIACIKEVLEKTPPELVGDIYNNGLILTGGGSMLKGLDKLIESETGIKTRVADNPVSCVAIGTGKAFEFLDELETGLSKAPIRKH